jgi:hypothetical protein
MMRKKKGMLPAPPVTVPAGKGLRDFGRKVVDLAPGEPSDEEKGAHAENLMLLPKLRGKHRTVPKEKGPRKTITDRVMLEALLEQADVRCPGCSQAIHSLNNTVREHTWALENRPKNADGTVTPDANDTRYIRLWHAGCDKQKTHGPGGTKRITTKGSDNHTREHRENLSASEAKFREKMAAKGKPMVPRR